MCALECISLKYIY